MLLSGGYSNKHLPAWKEPVVDAIIRHLLSIPMHWVVGLICMGVNQSSESN
jgi:hypothetical protein